MRLLCLYDKNQNITHKPYLHWNWLSFVYRYHVVILQHGQFSKTKIRIEYKKKFTTGILELTCKMSDNCPKTGCGMD